MVTFILILQNICILHSIKVKSLKILASQKFYALLLKADTLLCLDSETTGTNVMHLGPIWGAHNNS